MIELDSLTNEQLAGQRVMVGFEGKVLDNDLRSMISTMCVGGLILFKRNVSDPSQLAELCSAAQGLASESGNPPLMISIDQEGGPVARLGPPFTVFPGNRAIGEARSESAAWQFGTTAARELKKVGINMNLAPVLDVVPEGLDSPVMADRVFGEDPELVAELGITVIRALQENGVAACAKHFPGIGRTVVDSHVDLPYLDTERHTLDSSDLIPFGAAVKSGVAAVMLSHVVYRDLDPEWPAGFSSPIAKDLLRKTMGFEGVTMTDDLDMGAVDKRYDMDTTVGRILDAEVDVVLACRSRARIDAVYDALLGTVQESPDMRSKTLASVQRILSLKRAYLEM